MTLTGLVRERLDGILEVGARVWNDGPPIPPEDLPQLFQRFFRGKTGRVGASLEPGWGWPSVRRSSTGTAGGSTC